MRVAVLLTLVTVLCIIQAVPMRRTMRGDDMIQTQDLPGPSPNPRSKPRWWKRFTNLFSSSSDSLAKTSKLKRKRSINERDDDPQQYVPRKRPMMAREEGPSSVRVQNNNQKTQTVREARNMHKTYPKCKLELRGDRMQTTDFSY